MCQGVEFFDTYTKDKLDSFKFVPGEVEYLPLEGDGESKILWPTEDNIHLTYNIENAKETLIYRVINFAATFPLKNFNIDAFLETKHYETLGNIPTRKYEGYIFFLDSVSIHE